MSDHSDFVDLWVNISRAGGIEAYIERQLTERGYLVERKDTATMSQRQLAEYKKSLKKEAAEKRELKRKAWLAYKSSHIVHVGEGIFWNDANDYGKFDLINAEERIVENELPLLDKPKQLADALEITMPELRRLAYHRDVASLIHYRRFTIPKKSGEDRAIWAPLPRMKKAQHWILREIVERLPVHGAAHGFLAGRSIVTNARIHMNSKIIVRMDLRDFFPTVTFPRVKGIFRKAGYREQIATLLALICTEAPREVVKCEGKIYYVSLGPRCLPQGAPTSPGLSNTVSLRMDRRLSGLANKLDWRYTRYADDLTFSFSEKTRKKTNTGLLLGSVQRIVNDEGFQICAKKTWVARKGSRQRVTGLNVDGTGTPRVPRELRRNLRAAVHNLNKGKSAEQESIQNLVGLAAFVHMVQPELGAKLLDELKNYQKKD